MSHQLGFYSKQRLKVKGCILVPNMRDSRGKKESEKAKRYLHMRDWAPGAVLLPVPTYRLKLFEQIETERSNSILLSHDQSRDRKDPEANRPLRASWLIVTIPIE